MPEPEVAPAKPVIAYGPAPIRTHAEAFPQTHTQIRSQCVTCEFVSLRQRFTAKHSLTRVHDAELVAYVPSLAGIACLPYLTHLAAECARCECKYPTDSSARQGAEAKFDFAASVAAAAVAAAGVDGGFAESEGE